MVLHDLLFKIIEQDGQEPLSVLCISTSKVLCCYLLCYLPFYLFRLDSQDIGHYCKHLTWNSGIIICQA